MTKIKKDRRSSLQRVGRNGRGGLGAEPPVGTSAVRHLIRKAKPDRLRFSYEVPSRI